MFSYTFSKTKGLIKRWNFLKLPSNSSEVFKSHKWENIKKSCFQDKIIIKTTNSFIKNQPEAFWYIPSSVAIKYFILYTVICVYLFYLFVMKLVKFLFDFLHDIALYVSYVNKSILQFASYFE